jgi:hypothetical protein
MHFQSPVSIAAGRAADHMKKHSYLFVRSGPGFASPAETVARIRAIEECADQMARSQSYPEFEDRLREMHRLGVYARNADVSFVAHASLMAG